MKEFINPKEKSCSNL